jgi:predicted ester cyclase
MHHWGDGVFGAATHKPVVVRTVADCAAKDGQIYEEWLVRDQGAIARAVGSSPREMAQLWAEADRAAGRPVGFFTPAMDRPGTYHRPLSTAAPAAIYQALQEDLWNASAIKRVAECYHPAISVAAPSGETVVGHAGVEGLLFDYLSSFPGARFETEHLILREDAGRPARVALRWSLTGEHRGRGRFGEPTGKPIYIMGINHAEIRDGQVTAEWVLIDEIAVWKQILA